jgi:hypothetical protein
MDGSIPTSGTHESTPLASRRVVTAGAPVAVHPATIKSIHLGSFVVMIPAIFIDIPTMDTETMCAIMSAITYTYSRVV